MTAPRRSAAPAWVFGILLGSFAYFWHARDWNVSSRLMLTYALVDSGRLTINGLEDHTGDRARVGDRYYSDKLPGFSFLAVPPYTLARGVLRLPPHPLGVRGQGFTHWPADYWATLGTSGLASAAAGAILTALALGLGCGPRRAALVGLAYGLATPAYVYATLAVGHQATACFLLAAFALILGAPGSARPGVRAFGAGALAAGAATIELQVGPVAALLGGYLLVLVVAGRLRSATLGAFALGAIGPTLGLLAYNVAAFGSPFDMGYFHEDFDAFRLVHSAGNPLGLGRIAWDRAPALLWGRYRGLAFYAPIVALAPLGWAVLAGRRRWGDLLVTLGACLAIFLVNLSYPEWTGGFATGPRLLVPLLPFALVAVAAVLAAGGRTMTGLALGLTLLGAALMLLFQGAGGRASHHIPDPLRDYAWPAWTSGRFDRTALAAFWPDLRRARGPMLAWQFAPLVLFQVVAIGLMLVRLRGRPDQAAGSRADRAASS